MRITRIQELEAPGMRFIVPQATLDNLAGIPWLTPFLAANGDAMGSVHTLVLEVADQRIVVDTCIGNDKERRIPSWNKRQGPFLTQLTEAGIRLRVLIPSSAPIYIRIMLAGTPNWSRSDGYRRFRGRAIW